MPSFDVVSEVNLHELTNAVDQANRELATRFDFKGVEAKFVLEDKLITQSAPSDFQLKQMTDILRARLIARQIEPSSLSQGGYLAAQALVHTLQGMRGPITRASVAQALQTMAPWRSGMMDQPFRVGADGRHQLNRSALPMKLEAGKWRIAHTQWIQVGLITLMMGAAIIVAVSGVDKGVRVMSDINMLLACALLLFVLFAGPTQHLLNTLIQNLGDYLGALPMKSFDLYAYDKPSDWLGGWTVFYWAWWIAWSPFVGLFIARISRGRTIREFVFGVLLIPLGFTLAWMSIFGNSAIDQVLNHGMAALGQSAIDDPSMSLYLLLETYPWSKTVIAVTVFISFVFFVTSADSGTVVLSTLSSKGGNADEDGPKWLRVFWGAMTALVTSALLFAGSIDSLKSAVVLTSLPFSMILLLMMWGLHKAFYLESQKKIAQMHSLAPVSASRRGKGGWRQRLSQAVHFPSRDEVYRFMDDVVRPAIADVREVFEQKGLVLITQDDPSHDNVSLKIGHGEEQPFIYQVQMRGYFTPSFALGGLGTQELKNRRYYRAEVHLSEGSQDYDLVGYTKEQIINDILDQYERHMQFLHLVR